MKHKRKHRRYYKIAVISLATLSMLAPSTSRAQDDISTNGRNMSITPVKATARDDFGQYRLHVGSFIVSPKLTLEQYYDTNVFANETNEKTDFVTIGKPSLDIQKNIRDHEFKLSLSADAQRFKDNDNENIINYKSEFTGKLIGNRRFSVPFGISYRQAHRQRRQERAIAQSQEPLRFNTARAELGAEFNPNRLFVGLYGSYSATKNQDGRDGLGAAIIRRDGDVDQIAAEAVVKYKTDTNWAPFARLLVSRSSFKRRTFTGIGFNGLLRDNQAIAANVGISFNYKGLVNGSVALGREWRTYSDNNIQDIAALSAEASIEIKPRESLSIVFNASRDTEEDNEINNGIINTRLSADVDYELQKDLFWITRANYRNAEFISNNRNDDIYGVTTGLEYYINPRLSLGGEVQYNIRESNSAGASFDQTAFMLRLKTAL